MAAPDGPRYRGKSLSPDGGSAPSAPVEPAGPTVQPWETPEAKAELAELRAEMAEVQRLESLYDQWSTGTGVAKQYGGGHQFQSYQASNAYAKYKEARDAFTPKNDAWLAKYNIDWPTDGIPADNEVTTKYISTAKTGASTLTPEAWEKTRDMYVVKDPQTIAHNASLRSPQPSSAAKTWRSKVSRMVNAQRTTEDSTVFRVAAFTPEFAAQLRPGAVITDPGFTSVGEDTAGSYSYADVRLRQNAGTNAYHFHIQVPAGTPAAPVGYGEVVLDYGNSMEILEVGMLDGRRTVVVRLVPKASK